LARICQRGQQAGSACGGRVWQVGQLEKTVSDGDSAKKMEDLKTELEIAGSEMMRLQKALEEMEEWKEKLVKESKSASAVESVVVCLCTGWAENLHRYVKFTLRSFCADLFYIVFYFILCFYEVTEVNVLFYFIAAIVSCAIK